MEQIITEDQIVEEDIVKTEDQIIPEIEEKPKKVRKPKKTKSLLSKISCIDIGGTEEYQVDLTKEEIATFGSFKEKGVVIKLKDASVKCIAKLTREQYEELKKRYK